MSTTEVVQLPKLWKYLLGAAITLAVLIPQWTMFVVQVIQPNFLVATPEQIMTNDNAWLWPILKWCVLLPTIVVTLLFSWRWVTNSHTAKLQQQHLHQQATQAQTEHTAAAAAQTKREYVLEVISLGVTLDKYRQGKLWEALQHGSPYTTIRELDPKKYAWSAQERKGITGGRAGDALENGASYTPMYYGVPVFNAQPPSHDPSMPDGQPDNPAMGLASSAVSSGMAWHLFVAGASRDDEHPDHILDDVFAFFDTYPDVPYIVLNSDDDMYLRNLTRAPGTPPLMKDGYSMPEMPDASALFVLARRERVDPVRAFVWDDPDNEFVQNIFRWMYSELMESVPHPDRKKIIRTPAQVGADPTRHEDSDPIQRPPLVAEWLEAAAAFAQRPDIRGVGVAHMLDGVNPWAHRPPKDFKPTPWFPIPWNRDQLTTFDKLPTLGFIHRPTYVKFTDEHGKPITRRDEREKALVAGWQQALQTLPDAQRKAAPARIVMATGDNTDQLIALHATLNHYAELGGPELDSAKSSQFIDTDKRLGNTGASTLFMQMAIGVMGSYRDGGVSAAVNLRDSNEASIVFISPPTDEKRKNQQHAKGGNVFRYHGEPMVDPANYPPN